MEADFAPIPIHFESYGQLNILKYIYLVFWKTERNQKTFLRLTNREFS